MTRARDLVTSVPPRIRLLAGLLALLVSAYGAMGAGIWSFAAKEPHRFTARALLTGTLRLRNGVWNIGHDEQVFNGAGYTQWGFGVPLLQAPFHLVAAKTGWLPWRFFPDRTIYFVYIAAVIPALWAAFHRLLAMHKPVGNHHDWRGLITCLATLLTLSCTVYPLMSSFFAMYHETLCYLMLAELLALAAYVFASQGWGWKPVMVMGVASGIGLLVRPTGLACAGVWALLVALESKSLRPTLLFAAAIAPFAAFWLYSNAVRSGSPLSFGYSNSLPNYPYHVPIMRFGSRCADTPAHFAQAAGRLFNGLFFQVTDDSNPWLKACHFDFERRHDDAQLYPNEGFLGLPVLLLLLWMLGHSIARGRLRLATIVPFAAMVALFASYAHSVAGFASRYVGDFWPLIVLACVQYVRGLPATYGRFLGPRLAIALAAIGAVTYARHVLPATYTIERLDEHDAAALSEDFSRSRWSADPPFPSRLACGNVPPMPYKNGAGWSADCTVDTFTNVYLGVPAKANDDYVIRFDTAGMTAPMLRVYANGRIYVAPRTGDTYSVAVDLQRSALTSPVVMVTVEWTHEFAPPSGQLISIEIG